MRSGSPFRLSAQRGHAVLVSFGFTSCVATCPRTLAKLHALFEDLGPRATEVRALYVSVDPARDTPEHFKAFLDTYDPRIEGLYVEPAKLTGVLGAYKAIAIKRPPEVRRSVGRPPPDSHDYTFEHSASVWLIDSRGDLRERFSATATAEQIAGEVKRMLEER